MRKRNNTNPPALTQSTPSNPSQPANEAGDAAIAQKPKKTVLRKLLIAACIFIGAALLLFISLGALLLSRISKQGTHTFQQDPVIPVEITPSPASTPKPPQSAAPSPTITPAAEEAPDEALPEFEPLPLQDIYPQTALSDAQLQIMKTQNAEKSQFTHILLVGADRRGTRGDSNADTIMIATLDKRNNRLKLTSVLRDCFVPIPGFEDGRINSALAHGGMPLLLQTLNSMLHLELTNYVLVDFRMFEDIIDKMGGVVIRMSAAEISAANDNIAGLNKQRGASYLWDGFIFAEAGNVRLTGQQALAYARIRKIDSDFSRTNRQFKVLNTIFSKFRSKKLTEQYELMYDLLPLVETDLSGIQIIDIGISALSMDTSGILHATIPFEGHYRSGNVRGRSALALDLPMTAWKAHEFMYAFAGQPDEAPLLQGGPSLPPRTPGPTPPPTDMYPYGLPTPNDGAPTPTPTSNPDDPNDPPPALTRRLPATPRGAPTPGAPE